MYVIRIGEFWYSNSDLYTGGEDRAILSNKWYSAARFRDFGEAKDEAEKFDGTVMYLPKPKMATGDENGKDIEQPDD